MSPWRRRAGSYLSGHGSREEEVGQRAEEEEAGGDQEAQPPGADPAQVLGVDVDLVWRARASRDTQQPSEMGGISQRVDGGGHGRGQQVMVEMSGGPEPVILIRC